ncbi:MAG: CopG family transcriptional regulator [Rhizobacter sp.]|nr:CopG family transcriptional regulator [Rhizobacter sp.]
MELKTARLTLLIDPAKKQAFEQLCAAQDLTPSQVVRQLIRDYLTAHDVSYVPSGTQGAADPKAAPSTSTSTSTSTPAPSRKRRPAR